MRVLFFGMGEIGRQALTALLASNHLPVAVITKPLPGLQSTALARLCRRHRLALVAPDSPDIETLQKMIFATCCDVCAVAGYHKRIPASVLDLPVFGTLNLHDSLLPRYRGPNATRWVLMRGEEVTGVTVHRMTAEFDSGPLLLQEQVPITPDDNSASLFARISRVGARLLVSALDRLSDGTILPVLQDESEATYFSYPNENEMRIDWRWPAAQICNLVRGLAPSPAAWTRYSGTVVRIGHAIALDKRAEDPAGTVVQVTHDGVGIASKDRIVNVDTLLRRFHDATASACNASRLEVQVGGRFR